MQANKEKPPERPEPKPPIYPIAVIEVACKALDTIRNLCEGIDEDDIPGFAAEASASALRIIRDGLASHERAIRGES